MERMIQLTESLQKLQDYRKHSILEFHTSHLELMKKSRGSSNNHQAWEGGYIDHIQECFDIANNIYNSLSKIRALPFSLSSSLIVLYFHDIEKIWKYTTMEEIDKKSFLNIDLAENYNITFSNEEKNALEHIHGENEFYSNKHRVMNELAGFCNVVDTLSARVWWDKPTK